MDHAARARLAEWKQSLLDPTDQLLDLRDGGVPIGVDPVRLAFALAAGGTFALEVGAPGLEAGRLRVALAADELARELARLERAAADAASEGEHAVWLALGELRWSDAAGASRVSPLALWPVALVRDGDTVTLVAPAGHAPRANDVLIECLRADHGLALPGDGALDLAGLLDAAAEAAQLRGWQIERTARLAIWSFTSFDLWRDVEALADDLATRAPVAWLSGESAPPALPASCRDDVLAPLDADASQLAAIAAAGEGGTFVLHGAPGTGKSQTIANALAHCASQGKTVLFVSDRVTALDVVYQRLVPLGLADFCLPLYADHAVRARAVEGLARTLDRAFRPGSGPNTESARHADLRDGLAQHAAALHAAGAIGMSMHEVIGKLVELRTVPCAELAEPDAYLLERAGYALRKQAVERLADAAGAVEPVATHPWRAATPDAWPEGATERATCALDDAATAIVELKVALDDVGTLVSRLAARSPDQLRALGLLAELAAASPRPGAELLTSPRSSRTDEIGERLGLLRARGTGSLDVPRDPSEFLAIAQRHRALLAEVRECFGEDVELLDAPELWSQLKRWTTSVAPLRYVALRAARAEVRRVALPDALLGDEAMIVALEAVIAERACRDALRAAEEPARRWFGELAGDALAIDLERIEAATAWAAELRRAFDRVTVIGGEAARLAAWRALVAQVAASPDPAELGPFSRLAGAVARWEPAIAELALATGIPASALGAGSDHLLALGEQVAALRAASATLPAWAHFHLARRAALAAGVGPALSAIARGDLAATELAAAWERATLLAYAATELRASTALASFSGPAHHACAAEFADLDKRSLAIARSRALARLAERVPRVIGAADVDPQIATLRRERSAAPGAPLRAVLAEMPELLTRLAPCVLATPQAVARYLDPRLAVFDVVIFDEASRLPVAHALGALARARTAIVIGDRHQPAPPAGRDGLLERAVAAGWPELTLATHYRSRHHELFGFVHRRYYDERLELLPAPARGELGAAWTRVDGEPDSAGANRAEAEAIVAEIVRRATEWRSIAVVTMSRAQQLLIEQLLAQACGRDSTLAAALAVGPERLLIGTPDRLQGEERDVVLISIGERADGLGALAQLGGERWLAVAFTRARSRWIAYSSFAPEDIPHDAPPAARDLAGLLAMARDGLALEHDTTPASPITAAIARALGERGWTVHHRVGTGAFRLDLAIVDPEDPMRYVLAIEHDGAMYASARTPRDRDRLRLEQLATRGWRVHRIWSLDWWRDVERETQRAHGAIVAALAAHRRAAQAPRTRLARGSVPMPAPLANTAPVAAEASLALATGSGPTEPAAASLVLSEITAPVVKLPRGAIAIGPYVAAAIPAGRRIPDDMFSSRHLDELHRCVEQVLAAEAPIHLELLARRVAAYFGIGRVDDRAVEQVRAAVAGRGRFGDEQNVIWRLDQDPSSVPSVRVATAIAAARRDITEVPLSELAAAARIVVERANNVASRDLVRDCARLLGFARLTDKVSERVSLGVQLAAARQLIALEDGRARLPS
jgi:hypothetical protein